MVAKHIEWPSASELAANERRLVARLASSLRCYEARFGLGSDRLEQALAGGELSETADVTAWLMDLNTYRKLTGERSARVE